MGYKINLDHEYFVDVDDMNATLKQWYERTDKDGNKTGEIGERTIGYFNGVHPEYAIERYSRLVPTTLLDGMEVSLSEYLDALKKANKDTVEFLKNEFKPMFENFRGEKF